MSRRVRGDNLPLLSGCQTARTTSKPHGKGCAWSSEHGPSAGAFTGWPLFFSLGMKQLYFMCWKEGIHDTQWPEGLTVVRLLAVYLNAYWQITDKEGVLCIDNGILLSHKKEQNNTISNNMDGPRDYHTKWSKSDRERQIYEITSMWNLKRWHKWTYLQKETDSET